MNNKLFKKLKQSCDGAAVLMVLLVSVFVVIMGSTVVFSSYSGYLVQLVDRAGLDTFYTAEDYLDQTKASVQDFSSDSLQTAYTKVMSEYAYLVHLFETGAADSRVEEAAQSKFTAYFLDELDKIKVVVDSTSETGYSISTTATAGESLFNFTYDSNGTMNGGTYNAEALALLAGFETASEIDLEVANGSTSVLTQGAVSFQSSEAGDRIILHDVMISYTEDGYQSYITTDIIIEMPDFVHNGQTSEAGGFTTEYYETEGTPLDNAASIGKWWVKVAVDNDVVGDIYGGNFFLYTEGSNSGKSFNHSGGRLITHDVTITRDEDDQLPSNLTNNDSWQNYDTGTTKSYLEGFMIFDGMTFSIEEDTREVPYYKDSEVWAKNIAVLDGTLIMEENTTTYVAGDLYVDSAGVMESHGILFVEGDIVIAAGANVTITGETYVLGDLNISGHIGDISQDSTRKVTEVHLGGKYYGLGNGTTSDTASSILLNGNNINLDQSGLDNLYLAGLAYLNPARGGTENGEYALGQSMTSLPDQIAYLIPAGALIGETYNPAIKTDASASVTVNLSYELWPGSGKTIGDYMPSNKPKTIYYNYTGDNLSYHFFDFGDNWTENANNYFEDYMKYNKSGDDSVTGHLEMFNIDLGQLSDGATVNFDQETAGTVYYYNGSEIVAGSAAIASSFEDIVPDDFPSLSITLAMKDAGTVDPDEGNNPYNYYVNEALLIEDVSRVFGPAVSHRIHFFDTTDSLWGVYGHTGVHFNGYHHNDEYTGDSYRNIGLIVGTTGINVQDTTYYTTYEGLVMSGVGVALISPINSNAENLHKALEAKAEVKVYISGAPVTNVNSDSDVDSYRSNANVIAELEKRAGDDVDGDGFGDIEVELSHRDGYLTMIVPFASYFKNLDFYGSGSVTTPAGSITTPGAGETDVKVNWGSNDLVYFENYEKH